MRQIFLVLLLIVAVVLAPASSAKVDKSSPGFLGIPWHIRIVAAYASSAPIFLLVGRSHNGGWVSGTCFYLQRPSGRYIITADHVVEGAYFSTMAARVGQTWVPLRVVRQDVSTDLAALRPSGQLPIEPLLLRVDTVRQGETVAIIGFPLPDILGTANTTHVSGTVKTYDATPGGISGFWITAPAGPGNSGGPVLDGAGRVTGIVAYAALDGSTAFAVHGFYILKLLGESVP